MSTQCDDVVRFVRVHEDLDYVKTLQAHASLAIKMRRGNVTSRVIARKAALELDLGNYEVAFRSARDAMAMEPDLVQAHVLAAKACFYQGLTAAGVNEACPGTPSNDPAKAWLELRKARDILQRLEPHLDPEASLLLAFLEEILQGEPSQCRLVERLQRHFES